jgi:hypothetical protein
MFAMIFVVVFSFPQNVFSWGWLPLLVGQKSVVENLMRQNVGSHVWNCEIKISALMEWTYVFWIRIYNQCNFWGGIFCLKY